MDYIITELTATNQNVKTLPDSLGDTKAQRDKAQEKEEVLES